MIIRLKGQLRSYWGDNTSFDKVYDIPTTNKKEALEKAKLELFNWMLENEFDEVLFLSVLYPQV